MTHSKVVRKFMIISSFLLVSLASKAEILTISGVYQGKNLYVQNPFAGNMRDYCTNDVYVNEEKKEYNVASSAFEIDLSFLKIGDPVTVKITHKSDCKPKILNPQVIVATSAFSISSFSIDQDKITWTTKGERPKGKIFVEQMRYNTWVIVKELNGKGNALMNSYELESSHHSGVNQYRIKYLEADGQIKYSSTVEYTSTLEPLTFYPKRVTDKITLSRPVEYELQDAFGNVIRKSKGTEIDITGSPAGVYYLNGDNQTFKIYKK
jgi:hypothetical protein